MGASSLGTYVALKGKATMFLSDASVTAGTRVTFSGKAKPAKGSLVQLQRKEGSGWVTKKSLAPAANGSYVLTWPPSSRRTTPGECGSQGRRSAPASASARS